MGAKKRASGVVELAEGAGQRAKAPASPRQCRKMAEKALTSAWPDIVGVAVGLAKEGSVSHARYMAEVSGMQEELETAPRETKRKGFSLSQVLEESMEKAKAELKVEGEGRASGDLGNQAEVTSVGCGRKRKAARSSR